MTDDRLYFVVRTDLSEGKRAAQLIHVMSSWNSKFGPHQGTVIVYGVSNEQDLLDARPQEGRCVTFHEPDLKNQATAIATDVGRLELPLLGCRRAA